MDPAAPVTSTVLSATRDCSRPRSRRAGLRGRRSSICTSRICVYMTRPSTSSPRVGSTRWRTPASAHRWTMRRSVVPEAEGTAIRTSPISCAATSAGRSSTRPSTGTPHTRSPSLAGSSSTKPTTPILSRRRLSISLESRIPASPAPTIRARVSTRRTAGRPRCSRASRMARRAPPMSAVQRTRSRRKTARGKPCSPSGWRKTMAARKSTEASRLPRATSSASRALTWLHHPENSPSVQNPISLQTSRRGRVASRIAA